MSAESKCAEHARDVRSVLDSIFANRQRDDFDARAAIDRLKQRTAELYTEKVCAKCGDTFAGDQAEQFCQREPCQRFERAVGFSCLDRRPMLMRGKVPEKYREPYDADFHEREPRALDLAKTTKKVPAFRPESVFEWSGRPSQVTILGVNGCGKSHLAAEIAHRCVRLGAGLWESLFWILGSELVREEREEPLGRPRPLMHAAKTSAVVVIDDFGWPGQDFSALANLAEHRHGRGKPTIWTTHLPWASSDSGDSVRTLAPMIYDRQRSGLVVPLQRGSGR